MTRWPWMWHFSVCKTRGSKGHISCTWVLCATFWGIGESGHFYLLIGTKNTNLVEDVEILLLVKFRWIPFSGFREVKMSRHGFSSQKYLCNQRPGMPSCFFRSARNTNLVEDIVLLLPVKFRWIPFRGFRREVKNLSANQRSGRPSCFFRSARKTQTW